MKHLILEEGLIYDGSQIEPMWAFKRFGVKDSSIVSWVGPMNIESDNLIDYEDVGLEIKGDELLHFIIEHFDVQPANIRLCYHRQRLFVMIIKDLLEKMGIKSRREGDDLYFENGEQGNNGPQKLSVSIATCSNSSMKIHFALNLVSEGTPDDVDTAGIMECISFEGEEVLKLAEQAGHIYMDEISSIEKDIAKTKVF